jgi:hypothetical protein
MHRQPMIALFYVLEVMFFTGLVGCALVVVVSWISIFKSGFSDADEHLPGLHEEKGSDHR